MGQDRHSAPDPLTLIPGGGSLPHPMASFALFLQIAGMCLLPLALFVGMTAQHGMLAEIYLLGTGAALFLAGRFIGKRAASS